MTLVLIALAALAMAGTARRSIRAATDASDAQEALQRRWGRLSCERTILPQAENLLKLEEKSQHRPVNHCTKSLELGGNRFDIVVADECAKLDINHLAFNCTRVDLARKLREILVGSKLRVHLALHPITDTNATKLYVSYGQIFEGSWLRDLSGTSSDDSSAVGNLTLWSEGKINFDRADDSTLRVALGSILDLQETQKLLNLRRVTTNKPLSEILNQLELRLEQYQKVESLLTADSTCHSLWIVTTEGKRTRYHLAIRSAPHDNAEHTWVFDW